MENDLKQRTFDFARATVRLFSAMPRNRLALTIGHQFLRSGTSVGANYREANQARSKPEFISKMGDSLKELAETEYWLELMAAEEITEASAIRPLLDECRQLIAIFTTIIRKAKANS